MTLDRTTRAALRRTRCCLVMLSPRWQSDPHAQAVAAYMREMGKPFRVLVWPDTPIPLDAFAGITDLEVLPCRGIVEDSAQIQRWLAALHPEDGEEGGTHTTKHTG